MKKVLLVALLFFSIAVPGYAQTLHRWPLDGASTYSRWYDHNHIDKVDNSNLCTNGSSQPCPTRRYTGGAGSDRHHGTDILPNMTPNYIRATAVGNLYYRWDQCDNNGSMTNTCGGGYGNHVKIEHPDGKVTIYGHLYPGTAAWYQSILCGGTLGIMGNSGTSTGTHLHYEILRNRTPGSLHTDRIDPFGGPGNWQNSSLWVNQNGAGTGNPSTQCQ